MIYKKNISQFLSNCKKICVWKNIKIFKKYLKKIFLLSDYILLIILYNREKIISSNYKGKRRILIDVTLLKYIERPTGIPRVTMKLVEHLLEMENIYNVEILPIEFFGKFIIKVPKEKFLNKNQQYFIEPKSIIERIKLKLSNYIFYYKNILKCFDNDVLLCPASVYEDKVVLNFKRYDDKRVLIYIIHYLIPLEFPKFNRNYYSSSSFNQWLYKSFYYTDGFICVSETTKQKLLEYMCNKQISTLPYKIEVIKLGADIINSNISMSPRSHIKNIFSDSNVYISVSTIEPRKNYKYLIQTFEKLWNKKVNVKLLIVGRIGWKTKNLIEYIKKHPEYEKKLFMINDMSDEELAYSYVHSKALLFPSYAEGFGLPIVEALALKLPVIASDIGIHREIAGNNAQFFDIKNPNALFELLFAIESGKVTLKKAINSDVLISWKESANNIIKSILNIADEQ
jgi:glycosyltransferase involved in cell wall biosynthesis